MVTSNDIIPICNEQKIIFIKKILLITQEMLKACESGRIEEEFDKLLHERHDCMQRIEKCDVLLQKPFTENSEEYHDKSDWFISSAGLPLQSEFQSILQDVIYLNKQVEQRLYDKRKELIAAGVRVNPQKIVFHK